MNLDSKIQIITGVGPKIKTKLNKLGIFTFRDLVYYFPRAWKDYTHPSLIKGMRIGENYIIKARIRNIEAIKTSKKKMFLVRASLIDEKSDEITAVWFNQPFIKNYLKEGTTWLFSGKVGYDFSLNKKTLNSPEYTKKDEIIAVYPETDGVNSKFISKIVKIVLNLVDIKDFLPEVIIQKNNICSLQDAIKNIHFPKKITDIDKAKQRLSFDELFLISFVMLSRRKRFKEFKSYRQKTYKTQIENFKKSLPYKLTLCQQKAIYEILSDLSKNLPMTRLLDGDVGSGKTIVALVGAINTVLNSLQVAYLAPTEILAHQHFTNISRLLSYLDISIGLLTSNSTLISLHGKISKSQKEKVLKQDIVIGTHSLIEKDVIFKKLGLVIVDEEHRFGVKQRNELLKKSNINFFPHFLSMTATPIPRTLAISIYADLDISILDELPLGRKPITTRLVSPNHRQDAYDFVRKHIQNGRQAFVVCPLIEENKNHFDQDIYSIDKKSVKVEYDKLSKKIFPDLKIMMLHGKMKGEEKNKIMSLFSSGKIDILVSTSVVEVGVDVPNANFMIIEDADRFGLAQLHQFRGRVGRGEHKSFCLLFSNNLSPKVSQRLEAMEKYQNGFKLSQIDLITRGPGELIGKRQSGFGQLKIANLSDTITLKKARHTASIILKSDLAKDPELKKYLSQYEQGKVSR